MIYFFTKPHTLLGGKENSVTFVQASFKVKLKPSVDSSLQFIFWFSFMFYWFFLARYLMGFIFFLVDFDDQFGVC